MSKTYRVREGSTGILYLTDEQGREERFIPNYDLDAARELLLEFQELREISGKPLKDMYRAEGFNWYPTMVSFLYWNVFFYYVKYEVLIHQFLRGEVVFQFQNRSSFASFIQFITHKDSKSNFKTVLFYFLVQLNNGIVMNKYPADLLFFRFVADDFRSKEMLSELNALRVNMIQVLLPEKKTVLSNLFRLRPFYFLGGAHSKNLFRSQYKLDQVDKYKKILFEHVIQRAEWMISGFITEYHKHLQNLRNVRAKTFYGFDDTNGYIFPILYACQKNGIRTVAHQHGAYVKRHAAYIMEGIRKEDYRWFDKLIVWGEYWKEHLLHISKVYSPEDVIVGSNKLSWDYRQTSLRTGPPKNILIPYEFLTNTYTVGRYMIQLLDEGYRVYFKPRSDERLQDQLEAYCLPEEYQKKIHIVEKLDRSAMEQIDIIAGTMTTLMYELLPYNKIVWILETEYRHLEDLVEGGYAHKVRYDDLLKLPESFLRPTLVKPDYFFSRKTLRETILENVFETSTIREY